MSAVAAIIISEDKILLSKRSSTLSEEPNKWENMGESIDEKDEIKDLELAEYTKNDFIKLGWI